MRSFAALRMTAIRSKRCGGLLKTAGCLCRACCIARGHSMSTLTIRMPDAMHARLRDLARARGVSTNKLIEEMATARLSPHDAEVRFRLMAMRGTPQPAPPALDRR